MSAIMAFFYYLFLPMFSIVLTFLWVKKAKSRRHKRVAKLVCAMWFLWLTWNLVGGEKVLMDRKVDRLCTKDGGIKIYETVVLPAKNFAKYRYMGLPSKKKVKTEDEYYYLRETTYLKRGNPRMWKSEYKIYRKSDNKILGKSIRYSRQGGDLLGPWHETSYGCQEFSKEQRSIEQIVFVSED